MFPVHKAPEMCISSRNFYEVSQKMKLLLFLEEITK
jgi:hypothetical protein